MNERITLDECGSRGHLRSLPAGSYVLEYHDSTHLPADTWIQLADIHVQGFSLPGSGNAPTNLADEHAEQFFVLNQAIGDLPGDNGRAPAGGADNVRRKRVVADTLALALGRCGLLAPAVPEELLTDIVSLNREGGVVLVPDTNALHNGAMHWLLRVLEKPSVWILPLVASITTVQTRDATVKGLVGKGKIANITQALRSRGLVNGALGLLERNKGRSQVVEIDASLLRYQRMSSQNGTDPDQGDVLEDRLIIEGVHNVLKSMRSRTARRVVTSDVNIARVLSAEGIDTLFVPTIELPETGVPCVRYDALAKRFIGAPLRAVMWEIAHAFGSVRLRSEAGVHAAMECYWPGKSPADWRLERLSSEFTVLESVKAMDPEPQPELEASADDTRSRVDAARTAANLVDREEPRPTPAEASSYAKAPAGPTKAKSAEIRAAKRQSSALLSTSAASGAAGFRLDERSLLSGGKVSAPSPLPRAAFPQILQLLGAARRIGGGTVLEIVEASQGDRLSSDAARRALDILLRTGLIVRSDGRYQATADAELVEQALVTNDLDSLSAIFERFDPYKVLGQALHKQGRISRSDAHSILAAKLGPVGTYESERLPRYHVLLGQAWTNKNAYADGSNRPTDRDATDYFAEAFRTTATVGLAKVVDLLPAFCEISRMTPWAAKLRIERFVAERLLPGYTFQPAAGGKPIIRDSVVSGNLDDLRVEPVVIDRLHLGERPVFTIGGGS